MKCPECGGSAEARNFVSIAFPASRPFWRYVCQECDWFSMWAETKDALPTSRQRGIASRFSEVAKEGK